MAAYAAMMQLLQHGLQCFLQGCCASNNCWQALSKQAGRPACAANHAASRKQLQHGLPCLL